MLVTLTFFSQAGVVTATTQSPSIFSDTLVGSGSFIEGLELIAAEDSALIAQYYQWGGQKTFPLDPANSAFDELDVMYIISSNQANWQDYWPRSIWEFRDGATVVLQFSQGLAASLEDGDVICSALESWLGTSLDILYGAEVLGKTYLFYWGYLSPESHSDFVINEFYSVLGSGGYTNFITNEVIASAPVSVVAAGLVKTTDWTPLTVAAFILEDGIAIDGDGTHVMSINDAFNFSGSVMAAPDSFFSRIDFILPYVANVYDSYPETDNLYPELTGDFHWTLKAGATTNSYDDINVTYDMAVEELETFPQITGELSVDTESLHSPTDPVLNYTISLTNTGDETAYDVVFAWDLEKKPEVEYVSIFDSDNYIFDESITKYFNHSSGLLVDVPVSVPERPVELLIEGWFTYLNGTVVQPVSNYNDTLGLYEFDLEASWEAVYVNKSFFNFDFSSNIDETTLENGNYALSGTIDELPNGSTETFWWSISDLPADDDTFVILGDRNTLPV
ncbi:MAG: hypothetical protein ACTSP4_16005 [Candidatus Hodarchaeales archaeon]